MLEIAIDAPQDDTLRRSLVFDPRFHDTDALVAGLQAALVAHRELGAIGAAIQQGVQASDALQAYVMNLWRATADPAAFGVQLSGIEMRQLVLAGASPRGMAQLMRAARVWAWLQGRAHVLPEDVQGLLAEAIAHRLCLQPVYELRRQDIAPALVAGILAQVAAP